MLTDVQIKLLKAIEAYPNAEIIQGILRGDVYDFINMVKEASESSEKSTLHFDLRR